MVETSYDTTAFLLRQIYDRTKIQNKDLLSGDLVAEYFGDINEKTILSISEDIERKLIANSEQLTVSKRIFTIFIEGLQNIFKHGSKCEESQHIGAALLVRSNQKYHIHFFNVSPIDEMESMTEYLNYLNGLDLAETKKFYMERLVNAKMSEKGGASLGYIIMKLKSANNIKFDFEAANSETACYHIEVVLEIPEAK